MPIEPPAKAARDFAPNTPSATKPMDFCQAMTAALVFGPKLPSAETPTAVWRHFTCSPFEPTLNVVVIEQAAEAEVAFTATTPTNKVATTITPRRNFDFNKLLIKFSNFLRY
jgi:hypothetical protein